jgi:hypothetical protein
MLPAVTRGSGHLCGGLCWAVLPAALLHHLLVMWLWIAASTAMCRCGSLWADTAHMGPLGPQCTVLVGRYGPHGSPASVLDVVHAAQTPLSVSGRAPLGVTQLWQAGSTRLTKSCGQMDVSSVVASKLLRGACCQVPGRQRSQQQEHGCLPSAAAAPTSCTHHRTVRSCSCTAWLVNDVGSSMTHRMGWEAASCHTGMHQQHAAAALVLQA